ncbi:MAG: DNA-processing protein DprA [Pseudomonadota bacterium]
MPLPSSGLNHRAWLLLDLIPNLGAESVRKLLIEFGSPDNVLLQSHAELSRIISAKAASAIIEGADPEKLALSLKWLEQESNHIVTLADEDYPSSLFEIADPPPLLYLKGRRELIGKPCIAVVGSRNATPGGLQNAEAFSLNLSEAGLTIVSGLALGIDAAAHRGGLKGSASTIAVIGTGLDLVYPARNKPLAQEISQQGLIISEFSLGTPAVASNFPRRNRIISGLSRGVLVVEAALASGSLITARQAGEQGREVFAIPGSIHSPFSKGVHHLIKQGAKLVDEANDILVELQWAIKTQSKAENYGSEATVVADPILAAMGFDAVSADELASRTNIATHLLIAKLTEFELDGQIAQMAGGKYQRLS